MAAADGLIARYEHLTEVQPGAAKVVQYPVEGVHVLAKKGTGEAENQLTFQGFTEYIAQTVFAAWWFHLAFSPLQREA